MEIDENVNDDGVIGSDQSDTDENMEIDTDNYSEQVQYHKFI